MRANGVRIGVLAEEDGCPYLYTEDMPHRLHPAQRWDSAMLLHFMGRREVALDQVWIHESWAHHYTPAFWESARAAGWKVNIRDQGASPAWVLCTWERPWIAREIAIPCLDARVPWREARTGQELLRAVALFQDTVGIPYRFGPGTTGVELMHWTHRHSNSHQLAPLLNPPPPALGEGAENPLLWTRLLERRELEHKFLYSWDKNAAYLGACSSLELGLGEAEYIEHPGFDAHLPGYWHCVVRPWDMESLPDPLRPMGISRQDAPHLWLTTPTVVLAREWGLMESIHAAWVWRAHSRLLSAFYEVLRNARMSFSVMGRTDGPDAGAARVALGAVKACYTYGFGWLREYGKDAHGEALHRVDWRHHVIAQARANHFRTLVKVCTAGHAPFAVMNDCDYFLSDVEDAEAARPSAYQLGDGLGCYKLHDAVPMAAVRDILEGFCGERRGQALRDLQQRLTQLREGRA